jgi:hypothetical protein
MSMRISLFKCGSNRGHLHKRAVSGQDQIQVASCAQNIRKGSHNIRPWTLLSPTNLPKRTLHVDEQEWHLYLDIFSLPTMLNI